MLRLSRIRNVDFLSFGIKVHASKNLMWIEVEVGKLVFIIWLKDKFLGEVK